MRLKSHGGQIKRSEANPVWLLIVASVLSLVLWNVPYFRWLLGPVDVLVTFLHEASHALACLLTGGSVSGLTIVPDNQGHGGLTFCHGGMPLVYIPAGYLGTAVFGCLFLLLGRSQSVARFMLFLLSCGIGLASLLFMTGTIFSEGRIFEGVGSIVWGLALAFALGWSALNLRGRTAHFLFMFLAIQTALNAVASALSLALSSLGLAGIESWSDATSMQKLTMIPAPIWSFSWAGISIVMVVMTLWFAYGGREEESSI